MKKRSIQLSVYILLMIVILSSCSAIKNTSNQKKGIAVGATSGALLGGFLGNNVGNKNNTALGAILGAAIGGVAGGVIGKKMDNQAQAIKEALPGANVTRVGEGIDVTFDETNPDGSTVGIFFDNNKYNISSNSQLAIDRFKKIFNEYPDTNILIEGHTDNIGSEAYNESLSQRRAIAVSNALKNEGIAASRISSKWYGESQPKVVNSSDENRATNRRVQFIITANEKMIAEAKNAGNK